MAKKTKKTKRKKRTPSWALACFKQFICETERLNQVIDLSARGISVVRGMPKIVEVLMKVEDKIEDIEAKSELERAQAEAILAEREVKEEFPLLHAWAVISIWALLEAVIKSFVAEWLKRKPTAWRVDPIQRLKIRIGKYESIPRAERHLFVTELLERETGAGLKNGTTRFEALLTPFGLSGESPDIVRRIIFELGQVRNLIVHRGGRVDRTFREACPWVKIPLGHELKVSTKMWRKYFEAVHIYITLLICRVGTYFGADMSENLSSLYESAEKLKPKPSNTANAKKNLA